MQEFTVSLITSEWFSIRGYQATCLSFSLPNYQQTMYACIMLFSFYKYSCYHRNTTRIFISIWDLCSVLLLHSERQQCHQNLWKTCSSLLRYMTYLMVSRWHREFLNGLNDGHNEDWSSAQSTTLILIMNIGTFCYGTLGVISYHRVSHVIAINQNKFAIDFSDSIVYRSEVTNHCTNFKFRQIWEWYFYGNNC